MEEDLKIEHKIIVYSIGDDLPQNCIIVNPTSKSKEAWSKELSPFYLGPIPLYDGTQAHNLENAWQYSKVYPSFSVVPDYVIPKNPPHPEDCPPPAKAFFAWSSVGMNTPEAHRFPMGRGAIPMYSYWGGKQMGYVEARMKIYCPLYSAAVEKTKAWEKLKIIFERAKKNGQILAIFDFDGHNSLEVLGSYESILYNHKMKMGHGFVLAMMLEGNRVWEQEFDEQKIHFTKVPKRKNLENYTPSLQTIFAANLPINTTEEEVKTLFSEFNVNSVRFPKTKIYCFVEFSSHEDQILALSKYKNTPAVLGGNKLDIDVARQSKTQPTWE